MASPTLKLLVQIQSDLAGLNATVDGLKKLQTEAANTQKAGFSIGDAFKFAGAEEVLRRVIDLVGELGRSMADLAKESVNAAAEIQQEKFFLSELIGSVERANGLLEGLHSVWQRIGIVSDEALTKGAQALAIIGVPLENITPKLIEFSKIFAATNISIEDLVSGYQRLRQAVEHNNEAFVRGASAFGLSTKLLIDLLLAFKELPATSEGIATLGNMFKAGTITIDDLSNAIRKATTEGGRFDNAIELRRQLFTGAVLAMQTAWRGLEVEMGTPIIEVLTPVINRITDIEQAFARIAEDKGWQVAIRLAWEIVIDEVALLWTTTLTATFEKLGPAIAAGWFASWEALNKEFKTKGFQAFTNENMKEWGGQMGAAFTKAFGAAFGSNLGPEMEARKADLESALQNILQGIGKEAIGVPIEPGAETKEATGKVDMTRELTAALHDLEAAMAAVHQAQNLIAAQPFMGIDEKQRELVESYKKEILDLEAAVKRIKALQATGLLSVPQMKEANAQVAKAGNQIDVLHQKILGMQHDFRAGLQDWANSFGTVGHQLANTLQQTVGVALQALNTYLVTGKFNAQQLLQQIVMLGLQVIEQMIIQRVVNAINAAFNIAQGHTQGAALAAAWAPAATAATIATTGAAAAQAPAAVAGALASIEAVLVGGTVKHAGGPIRRRRMHSGGLAADEVPIIAQEGEIMIQRSVAQAPGMSDFLLGLNAGFHSGGKIRRFHRGGGEFHPELGGDYWANLVEQGSIPSWSEPPDLPEPPDFGTPSTIGYGDDPRQNIMSNLTGFGTSPSFGASLFGHTQVPTFWVNYPGVGNVPMAVPAAGWNPDPSIVKSYISRHTPAKSTVHGGGLISRMHSGGAVGGGGGGGVHIYAFTDLKALTRHMAGKDGQKIIFDTVKGRRIDLGIS